MSVPPEELVRSAAALVANGRSSEALELLRQGVRRNPEQLLLQLNLGFLLLTSERHAEALTHLLHVRAGGIISGQILLATGICRYRLGHFAEAVQDLREATQRQPDLSLAAIFQARALLDLGQAEEARAALALIHSPEWLPVEEANEYALALIGLQEYESAERVLRRALQSRPDDPYLKTNLAQVCERGNRLQEARELLEGAYPLDAYGRLLESRLMARLGDPPQALERLGRLRLELAAQPPGPLQVQVEFERGKWLDQLGCYDEAFDAYQAANELERSLYGHLRPQSAERSQPHASSTGSPLLIDHPGLDAAITKPGFVQAGRSPIFLVGFPRSGTTLLDNMLNAHPDVAVIEERPLLDPIVEALRGMPDGYPQALANLADDHLQALRELFWQTVARHSQCGPQAQIVDKNPFNLLRVHLIERLFPGARWIFAIRHPLDVVLSCFMQRFQFTPVTQGFWDLDTIADTYVQAIGLWQRQRSRLGIAVVDVRYEDLIEDSEQQLRRVIERLNLSWHPAVLDHLASVRSRWIHTPSYDQVAEPVHRRAVGRWVHYRHRLAEIEPRLTPFIRAFGYG